MAGRGAPGDREAARAILKDALARFEAMGAPGYEAVVKARLADDALGVVNRMKLAPVRALAGRSGSWP